MQISGRNCRIDLYAELRPVGLNLGIETADHFIPEFQIHQAQRTIQLGSKQWTLPAQMKADVASEREGRRLYSGNTLERKPGTGEVENGLAVGGVRGEISSKQAGGRRIRILCYGWY